MENTNQKMVKTGDENPVNRTSTKKPYWNGKTSDHPVIQRMIEADNKKFQTGQNKFGERAK